MTMLSLSRISPIWPRLTRSLKPVRCRVAGAIPGLRPARDCHRGIRRKMMPPRTIVRAAIARVARMNDGRNRPGYGSSAEGAGEMIAPGEVASRSASLLRWNSPNVHRVVTVHETRSIPTSSLWLMYTPMTTSTSPSRNRYQSSSTVFCRKYLMS